LSQTGRSGNDRTERNQANGATEAWVEPGTLEGVRRLDPKALGVFFDGAFPFVYSIAFRFLGSKEMAEDATQDVFVKVYQAAGRLKADRSPKPWLTAITYNTCRDVARRVAVRQETPEDPVTIGDRSGDSPNPEEVLLDREMAKITERALLVLDEESRAIVILHDFCDTSHEDIAGMMGLSHGAVRKRYSRSLKQMAEIIRGLL
jgi:RNA polymerase sigma-70 factor (ECF subfamily)